MIIMVFLCSENCRLAVFFAITLQCAILDVKYLRVPRFPLLCLIVFLSLTALLSADALTGMLAGIVSFYVARKLTLNKIGLADVWMAGCIGSLGGLRLVVMATMCAIALVLPCSRKVPVPFIPPLLAGSIYSIIIFIFLGN